MTQISDLVDHARAQGVAYFQGKVATGNTFESARVLALVPAIKAIEAGEVTLESNLPGDVTRAYAEGARIEYGTKSLSTAISKTLQFLMAAQAGVCTGLFHAVDAAIRETNDADTQKVMCSGAFEKLTDLCRVAIKTKAVPDRATIVAVLAPQAANPSNDETLAQLFAKMAKLAKNIVEIEPEKYYALAIERKRYEQLGAEHTARAKRAHEQATTTQPVTNPLPPVATTTTTTTTTTSEEGEVDDVTKLLAA
jgi:hypothetical protein